LQLEEFPTKFARPCEGDRYMPIDFVKDLRAKTALCSARNFAKIIFLIALRAGAPLRRYVSIKLSADLRAHIAAQRRDDFGGTPPPGVEI
jgi:hypothetical protein